MTDGTEGGFNGVGRPQALPVLCRKVKERQQFFPVFLQAQRGFGIFALWS